MGGGEGRGEGMREGGEGEGERKREGVCLFVCIYVYVFDCASVDQMVHLTFLSGSLIKFLYFTGLCTVA